MCWLQVCREISRLRSTPLSQQVFRWSCQRLKWDKNIQLQWISYKHVSEVFLWTSLQLLMDFRAFIRLWCSCVWIFWDFIAVYLSGLLHFLCCLLELFPFITAMRRLSSIWETVSVGQKVKCDGFCLIHLLEQKGKYKMTVLPSAGQRWLLQTAEGSNFFIIFFFFTNQ